MRRDASVAIGVPPRSPLAVKQPRPRPEGEGSLCAIKIAREAVRATNQRLEPRQDSEAPVALAFRGDESGATVLNISSKGAMVASPIEAFIGERLQLTFPGDERIDGVVRWVRDGRIGVEFGSAGHAVADAPVPKFEPPPLRNIVVDDEPEKQTQSGHSSDAAVARNFRRARVLLAARLETPSGMLDARLRDLSCKGALLECNEALAVGQAVVFVRGDSTVPARIAWTSGARIGLEFDQPIEESEVLVHVNRAPPPPQNPPPHAANQFRRPNFTERLNEFDRKLARVIGASLGVSLIDE